MLRLFLLVALARAQIYVTQEQFMTPPQIIANRGYPAETHTVVTPDGYILTLHRIPRGRVGFGGGRPVLLQHGLFSSSFDFLSTATNLSLSYSLADAGYDVWLGNHRGNLYSNGHVTYSNLDKRFYNFTWDEMSLYDYPAIVDYILNVTRQPNLYAVGHSQGGHTFFTSTTSSPAIQAKVKYFFAIAPSLSSTHLGSALLNLGAQFPDLAEAFFTFLPDQAFQAPLLGPFCGSTALSKLGCHLIFNEVAGPIDQIADSLLPLATAHFPAGTSDKNMIHWLQQVRNGTRYFDYGSAGNLAAYGTPYPREFNFANYSVPTSMYFSPSDKLVSTEDMNVAFSRLPASAIQKIRNITGFGHFEFIWGNRAKAEVYDEIIADINRMEVLTWMLIPFLLYSPIAVGDSGCFWLGTSPVCLPDACPDGTTEITQAGAGSNADIAYFGNGCSWWFSKRLCCKNSVVKRDPNENCAPCNGCERKTCPIGQVYMFTKHNGMGRNPFCCNNGTLMFN